MKTIDIESHFTELDRSILENNVECGRYVKFVTLVLDVFSAKFAPKDGTQHYEVDIIRDFADRFLATLRALGLKYLFEEEDRMQIDLTDSGFPNHLEIRKMVNDLDLAKKGPMPGPDTEQLRRLLLDKLIAGEETPTRILRNLALDQYQTAIKKQELFGEFVPGGLKQLKIQDSARHAGRYLCSWASYDSVTNRPFVYLMVFDSEPDQSGNFPKNVEKDPGFVDMIRKATHNTAPLKVVAMDIDDAYPHVHPKVLKRIDIGPIISEYELSEDVTSKAIREQCKPGDFLMNVTTEIVFSVGQKDHSKGLLSKTELREIFQIDETNKDCMERMVSEVHRYMFVTHPVLQYVNDSHKELLKNLSTPPFICPACL